MTALTFIILGLSGLNITFGKSILLPLIGAESFSSLSALFKLCHNYLAWPFMIGVVVMLLLWVKDNIPNGGDIAWFKSGGGLIGDKHVESKRFNGGQKLIFWTVILGGLALSWSGLMLLFPGSNAIASLLTANTVHALIGAIMVAIMIAHIYIGSVGMEGASKAMTDGQVDLNWAKEHHGLWVKDVLNTAKSKPAE
jgi:formate dehydrogenase subunit gamma